MTHRILYLCGSVGCCTPGTRKCLGEAQQSSNAQGNSESRDNASLFCDYPRLGRLRATWGMTCRRIRRRLIPAVCSANSHRNQTHPNAHVLRKLKRRELKTTTGTWAYGIAHKKLAELAWLAWHTRITERSKPQRKQVLPRVQEAVSASNCCHAKYHIRLPMPRPPKKKSILPVCQHP